MANNAPQDVVTLGGSQETGMVLVQKADSASQSEIKLWLGRIKRSKQKFDADYKRMRRNMEFATGLQWNAQKEMDDERYTNNIVLRMVNQKVATLYAKNPTAVAERRPRMEYQIWDGRLETIMQAVQQAQQIVATGGVLPPEIGALFADFQNGKTKEKLIDRVCETLEKTYSYQVETQRPEFKEQVKQAVRRVIICGVAYARPIFVREGEQTQPSSVDAGGSVTDRVQRVKGIISRLEEGELDQNDSEISTLRSLALSLGASSQQYEAQKLEERLEFDFPPATSIIPDTNCRNLKEWVAARWIAQEYVLPVEDVNEIFGTKVSVGSGPGAASQFKQPQDLKSNKDDYGEKESDPFARQLVELYEVFDYRTKSRFYICGGYDDYVLPPEPVCPVAGFWHHYALTFNDVEVEPGTNASIFPPSDVQLIKSPQKEWNRTREGLRDQRNANAPKYLVRKGKLTEDDKAKLRDALPNSVVELEGVPPDQKLSDFIVVMQTAPIEPAMYDSRPLSEDIMMGVGMQEANIGPAQPNVTATVGTIAEQSRLTVSASNIDDLDSWLSRIAQGGGELLLREMSPDTVKRIVGPGAVWPMLNRDDFVNEIFLRIKAASSGRPNKAISVANFQQIAPIMLQAGANPVGVIEEGAKRLDDNIDISKFFPVGIPAGMGGPTESATMPGPQQSELMPPSTASGALVSAPTSLGELGAPSAAVGRVQGLPSRVDVPALAQQ